MPTPLDLFALPETVRDSDHIVATYVLELPADADALVRATRFAVGQTIGTWLPVPGITDDMRARHEARVLSVYSLPPSDTTRIDDPARIGYVLRIAVPTINFGASLPMLLTTVLGNDSSTSVEAKLVDLEMPESFTRSFSGPAFGVEGLRRLTGVQDRPLLLNMLKPCAGMPPTVARDVFFETALGGIDLIKDDELTADPEYSPVVERVRLFTRAAREAAQETGIETIYIPNVSDRPDRMIDTARRAVDAGARAVMATYATVGYGSLEALAEAVDVPVLAHFAGAAPYFEGPSTGMSAPLAMGLLPRLAGADLALVSTPYGGATIRSLPYQRTVHQLLLPRPGIAPTMPVIGGGVHPGTVARYVADLGVDIVLGAGGAVQGHPGGAAAGVRAMRRAIDAAVAGIPVEEAAADTDELRVAIDAWGVI
ncbi:RuBisCO large subunit C-terminal-like domain-containing protein [Microbacterium sp. ACRRU]|uniref:RuBisCO large subunit C-terminal-like domain-containing protein n=1 Tax=Microbacterium sp. ACRRU TaxID=2918204 RepID=UPI001EF5702A|nr:RuBisCO large subunit C-terminal-like domain-containing protein [Microbacterium sp. ACRRU]MCG7417925.1 RuBisCO large subunit C-terminal-like domain-containing protein [Microbacterium sp. ACRRU]